MLPHVNVPSFKRAMFGRFEWEFVKYWMFAKVIPEYNRLYIQLLIPHQGNG
jgi:hypothetical protein